MKDTIYREDAINAIKDADVVVFYDKDTEIDDAIEIAIRCTKKCLIGDIEELPSAEPVRCKDCKHWYPDADCGMACEFTNMSQPEDGYCNWGVKKDGRQKNIK